MASSSPLKRVLVSLTAAGLALVQTHAASAAPAAKAPISKAPIANSAVGGLWDATVRVKEAVIPFRIQFSGSADHVKATYFDGERPVNASTDGALSNGVLQIDFPSYDTWLNAKLDNGVLHGTIGKLPFEAHRHVRAVTAPAKAPSIAGVWEIPIDVNAKGEKAWRLVVTQKTTGVYTTILRVDGDTGTIGGAYEDGAYSDGSFKLSRFAGERPTALTITPQADGSLSLVLTDNGSPKTLKAYRPTEARRLGLAEPTDPTKQTSVANSAERFIFSGADLATGKEVAQTDPRFKGKVVLVAIMGSWCPNCHDEAPFLAELDAKYRARGLRIVGLDFEGGPDDLKTLSRLKAFVARYGLRYTILVGGERKQLKDRVPQAVNLNAWPTSFFVGRDGRVHAVHVGFPSQGSAEFTRQAKAEVTHEIESLLADKG